jgi:F-type H+-transporting ATPase subunit epsilon
MSSQFQFELVSPEKIVLSKPAVMVTVPGGEGDFGVLVGHSPLITTVRPGVIEVYADNDNTITDRIFVAGGFAEVTGERCAVLAEEAVPVSSLDRAKLEDEAKTLANAVNSETKLAVIKAKLDAIR